MDKTTVAISSLAIIINTLRINRLGRKMEEKECL